MRLPDVLDRLEGATPLEQAVAGIVVSVIHAVTTEERGCMISTGLIEQREPAERRRTLRDRIADGLNRGLVEAEAERLAAYLCAVRHVTLRRATTQGLSRLARTP